MSLEKEKLDCFVFEGGAADLESSEVVVTSKNVFEGDLENNSTAEDQDFRAATPPNLEVAVLSESLMPSETGEITEGALEGNSFAEDLDLRAASPSTVEVVVVSESAGQVAAEFSSDDGGVSRIVSEKVARTQIGVASSDGAATSATISVLEKGVIERTGDGVFVGLETDVVIKAPKESFRSEGSEKISASQVRLRKTIPKIYEDISKLNLDGEPEVSVFKRCCMPEGEEVSSVRRLAGNICEDVSRDWKKVFKFKDKCCKPTEAWTKNLQKARNFALRMLGSIVFPLFFDFVRDIWVGVEFVLALVGLGLSIATLSLDHNEIFNLLHLALAITSFLLSLVDIVFNRRCKSCKCCSRYAIEEDKRKEEKCGKRCFSRVKKVADILRAIVSEVLIYPLLMCNILSVITRKGYDGNSSTGVLGFVLFILSGFSLILYVYALRILVMLKVITGRRALGRPRQEWLNQLGNSYDPSLGRSNFYYQIWFFMNMVSLMIVQVLMIIAIGAKMYVDNQHFYEEGNKNEDILISPILWYMMTCGYVAPFLGFLSYLLITMPWARDFFLGIFYDVASLWKFWKKGGIDDLLPGQKKKEDSDTEDEMPITREWQDKFLTYFESFVEDLKEYRNVKFCVKVVYPFTTFIVFPPCVLYFWMQIFFVVSATSFVLDLSDFSGGWLGFYLFAVPFAGLCSTHIFIIGFMWSCLLYNAVIGLIFAIVFSPCILLYYLNRGMSRLS